MNAYRKTQTSSGDAAREHAKLTRARDARQRAERNFRAAIVAARQAGLTAREIGAAVDLTHVRVLQIEREEADRG